jgi:hypothetical protein
MVKSYNYKHNYIVFNTATGLELGGVIVNPTGNCQLSSYIQFEDMIDNGSKDDFEEVLTRVRNDNGTNLILLDIRQAIKPAAVRLIKDRVIFITDYTSSNDSPMCIIMIKNRPI